MLKQSIEQLVEGYEDGPMPVSVAEIPNGRLSEEPQLFTEQNTIEAAHAESEEDCQAFFYNRALSELAINLTARRRESVVSDFVVHLAKLFGGGLRTRW